jgi:peptidoglycan/xylan/chitin deacetylase (PgdA/CDA1 family)
MRNTRPIISFSFDDFPRSAFIAGAKILGTVNAKGTYYVSLGLCGRVEPTGEMFVEETLERLIADEHELGCHTFEHCHSWETSPQVFERSVKLNSEALVKRFPGAHFSTLSYPISCPRPGTKRRLVKHFQCCRGGGQTYNRVRVSRTHVRGFFLEQSRDNIDAVKRVIDENCAQNGWLVFATHDIESSPTRFGCTPEFFRTVVTYAASSGAIILPVREAWHRVTG